jgi:hypothetical protein
MDLEILEALALGQDRAAALGQLLPGSEDHDYYAALHAQHRGDLDEAETIIEAWSGRHGRGEGLDRLRLRQLLYRLGEDPQSVADDVRDHFGVSHWHEAEVDEVDPTRPTQLAPGEFDGTRLLSEAVDQSSDLSLVTDEGIEALVDHVLSRTFDTSRRRALLQRLDHSRSAAIVEHVARDLEDNATFGGPRAHQGLTRAQLEALATRVPKLRSDARWIEAMVRRMRPPAHVDLDHDLDARERYVRELWAFLGTLAGATLSLRAQVLWHLLDVARRRDVAPERALVLAYLQLPRAAHHVRRSLTESVRASELAQLGTDFRAATGLGPAGSDEELVRDFVHRDPAEAAEHYAPWLERAWLDAELATAHLLYATGDAQRATQVLGPTRAADLRDRIDLAWSRHNPAYIAADTPLALDADLKHVAALVVKVFRIDPLAYFQHHRREVDTDLDLDGLAASHELVLAIGAPAIRRVRRRIELPMCTRPGTYVIDLIGNGMSSRAVIHKGRLRHVARIGAAGHLVTVLDEAGQPVPGARGWLIDREYIADERGTFAVPFSTSPGSHELMLAHGDVTAVRELVLARESYALTADIQLDRQVLTEGATARAIARVRLTVAGAPASLALLEQTTWDVTLTDRHGVATTKQYPLVLSDDDAAVLEWPLGEAPASVTLTIRGMVKVISEQREDQLTAGTTVTLATMHAGTAPEALYLAHTADGWVLSALGKTGEPRGQRPISVVLTHRWAHTQLVAELATDARGRCELGTLDGVARISATLGAVTQTWVVDGASAQQSFVRRLHGEDIALPLSGTRRADDAVAGASLVEVGAGGVPIRHVDVNLVPLVGGVVVRGLSPGEYGLRAPGLGQVAIHVVAGAEVSGHVVNDREVAEPTRSVPVIGELAIAAEAMRVRLEDHGDRTRVHVLATRFVSAPVTRDAGAWPPALYQLDRARPAGYVSGRELGDEYRYVLERRAARRFPSLRLDKPSLLLNPWARRTTTTDVATARAGGAFAAASPARQSARYAPAAETRAGHVDEAAYLAYDFIAHPAAVLANLVPDEHGVVSVPIAELAHATSVVVIVDDPAGMSRRELALSEPVVNAKDLRLRLALDIERHATQRKAVAPLRAGDTLVIEDLATAKLHLIDSVERAHAYLLALGGDAAELLRELAFVTRWHQLADSERRELYSKYACHELHLFLYFKDRAFFDAVIRPYLAHKRTKTFVDHFLLDTDLSPYLEPWRIAQLNAVERALLAQRIRSDSALVRLLADPVAVQPPDPARDTLLIDTLLGASRLDADSAIEGFAEVALDDAYAREEVKSTRAMAYAAGMPGDLTSSAAPAGAAMPAPAAAAPPPLRAKKKEAYDRHDLDEAVARRRQEAPMFRVADKTQEWAENNWWHQRPGDCTAQLVEENRFWRDLAQHDGQRGFLSPWLGLATSSFAEAMCALAVIDLPFVAGKHDIRGDGPRLTVTAAASALAGSSQLVDAPLVEGGPPVVVGQSYVRADDRHAWLDGEQIDKYVEGAFLTGVVYTCQVVLANPSSTRQRIAALVQIPRGSIALAGARQTQTLDVVLDPYGTHGHEYSFYFPAAGSHSHFGVHVSRGGTIVAAAPGRMLDVVVRAELGDPTSWSHVSQRGSLPEVVAFLAEANLANLPLEQVAWRLRERAVYDAILTVLEQRHVFDPVLWGYALLHADLPRIRAWARTLGDQLHGAGPVLEMPIVELDGEQLATYEHLEYAPLTNARAHRLGAKHRILNEGLAGQYQRFLELVGHRPAPTAEDLLAAAAYLLAQDRHAEALATLSRVEPDAIADRMQHDYLVAYASCLTGDITRARELVTRWRQLPVERWRRRFDALANMLAELGGAAPAISDATSRDQQQAELAAKQPTFELAVDRDGVVIRQQHVASLELRFFAMDVELLFSRQPFVQSDVSRFSFIEPGHREHVVRPPTELRMSWPAVMRGKNVVVEAVGAGQRKAKIHYANDLATDLAHQYGQIRVQRASDAAALAATYIKVYARKHGGAVSFYKDGYTDLRGWFDYATLSTSELDHVERFAILVCSDQSGAAILEANPPAR